MKTSKSLRYKLPAFLALLNGLLRKKNLPFFLVALSMFPVKGYSGDPATLHLTRTIVIPDSLVIGSAEKIKLNDTVACLYSREWNRSGKVATFVFVTPSGEVGKEVIPLPEKLISLTDFYFQGDRIFILDNLQKIIVIQKKDGYYQYLKTLQLKNSATNLDMYREKLFASGCGAFYKDEFPTPWRTIVQTSAIDDSSFQTMVLSNPPGIGYTYFTPRVDLTFNDSEIFVSDISDYGITAYGPNGEKKKHFQFNSSNWKATPIEGIIDKNTEAKNGHAIIDSLREFFYHYSSIESIHMLDDSLLLVQWRSGEKEGGIYKKFAKIFLDIINLHSFKVNSDIGATLKKSNLMVESLPIGEDYAVDGYSIASVTELPAIEGFKEMNAQEYYPKAIKFASDHPLSSVVRFYTVR